MFSKKIPHESTTLTSLSDNISYITFFWEWRIQLDEGRLQINFEHHVPVELFSKFTFDVACKAAFTRDRIRLEPVRNWYG